MTSASVQLTMMWDQYEQLKGFATKLKLFYML
jgi:hypothetical protein